MYFCSVVLGYILLSPLLAGGSLGTCSQEKLRLAECAKPHKEYVRTLTNLTLDQYLNRSVVSKFVEFAKTASACIGNASCDSSRHYRFFLDALSYIGGTYVEVETPCLQGIRKKLEFCFDDNESDSKTIRKTAKNRKIILECAIVELTKNDGSCVAKGKSMYKAAQALYDLQTHYKTWQEGSMKPMVFNADSII